MPGRSGRANRKELLGDDESGAMKKETPGVSDDMEAEGFQEEPLTTEEKIKNKRQDITDTNDDTIDMINQAKRTGAETNKKLANQNEQLRRAGDDLDEIDENMDKADHSLGRMEMCCLFAICCCCCHESAPKKRKIKKTKIEMDGQINGGPPKRKVREDENENGLTEEERHERKVNNQLDDIADGLDVLNQLAKDQGELLQEGAEVNHELRGKIAKEKVRVRDADRRGRALLR